MLLPAFSKHYCQITGKEIQHGSVAWCQSRSDPKLKCNAWLLGPYELNRPFLKHPYQHLFDALAMRPWLKL